MFGTKVELSAWENCGQDLVERQQFDHNNAQAQAAFIVKHESLAREIRHKFIFEEPPHGRKRIPTNINR